MSKHKLRSEKLHNSKGLPKVKPITDKMSKRWGYDTVAIPSPIEVNEIMKNMSKGKLTTINEIRAAIAKKHGVTIGCPMTTGIFAWPAAHAAEKQKKKGEKNITPYWRTLKAGEVINKKYPGGAEAQKRLLEMEGRKVAKKGQKYVIVNYERALEKF